jgi:hypothetical protein
LDDFESRLGGKEIPTEFVSFFGVIGLVGNLPSVVDCPVSALTIFERRLSSDVNDGKGSDALH